MSALGGLLFDRFQETLKGLRVLFLGCDLQGELQQ